MMTAAARRQIMGSRTVFALFAAFCYATLPAPLIAEQTQSKAAKDPNEKICENQTVIGSRLATHRVCATRAEWVEKRRLDKDAVDSAQRSPNTGCMTINTHSGPPAC
jgi:hypothetical protein